MPYKVVYISLLLLLLGTLFWSYLCILRKQLKSLKATNSEDRDITLTKISLIIGSQIAVWLSVPVMLLYFSFSRSLPSDLIHELVTQKKYPHATSKYYLLNHLSETKMILTKMMRYRVTANFRLRSDTS